MKTFAQRISLRRTELGLTQIQVARAIGVSVSTYKEWEHGRRIQGEESYVKLSRILEMNLYTLLTGEALENRTFQIQTIQDLVRRLDQLKESLLSSE
jgi:transcriptional regulator with XRE-family HTH domain